MTPAPKARIQRSSIVANPDNATLRTPEDHLIQFPEDVPQFPSHLANGDIRSRSESPATAVFGTSPKATFIRRSSNGTDGNVVAFRGNAKDMREHLKNLGPSNLASRPKTTRYNTVKIKPGQGSIRTDSRTDSNSNTHRDLITEEPSDNTPLSPAPRGGAGEGLLRSAGKDASDGVQALHQGYGTLERGFSYNTKNHHQPDQQKDRPSTTTTDVQKSASGHSVSSSPNWLTRVDSDRSSDTVRSSYSTNHSPIRRKREARSGGIEEHIIEAGGVRKVILETNSSSSDDKDDQTSKTPKKSGKSYENSPPEENLPLMHDEHTQTTEAAKGEEAKKKRRRPRKKKDGKPSEEGAFLGKSTNQRLR
jgi:metal transporter CNNM